jgi:DnaJ-class molecular chaperone
VRRDATAFEVRRAYEAARRDYAPEAFSSEVQREQAEPLREIAVVLDEAYRVLRDDAVRTRYLANLKD